jgi:pimeloyl-ACP methyl ester carboxylesterase
LRYTVGELAGFLARSGLRGLGVVGHSLGGLIALTLAMSGGLDLEGLVIIDTPTRQRGWGLKWLISLALKLFYRDAMEALVGRHVTSESARRLVLRDALSSNREVVRDFLMEALSIDLSRELCENPPQARTLLILTRAITTEGGVERFLARNGYRCLTRLTVKYYGDSGHYPMLEAPRRLAEDIKSFLGKPANDADPGAATGK